MHFVRVWSPLFSILIIKRLSFDALYGRVLGAGGFVPVGHFHDRTTACTIIYCCDAENSLRSALTSKSKCIQYRIYFYHDISLSNFYVNFVQFWNSVKNWSRAHFRNDRGIFFFFLITFTSSSPLIQNQCLPLK